MSQEVESISQPKTQDDQMSRLLMGIGIVFFSALAGALISVHYGNDANSDAVSGAIFGTLIGITVILAIEYGSTLKSTRTITLFLIPLMLVGVFAVTAPVHAEYAITTSFIPTPGTASEICQPITIEAPYSSTPQTITECTALGATVYKDISEQDASHDYYLIAMNSYAMNGTNDSCDVWRTNCGYPVVMHQIVASIGIGLPSGTFGLSGPNPVGPGSTCTNSENSVSVTFAGVGLSLVLPAQCTTWNSSPNYNWNTQIQAACSDFALCYPDVLANNGQFADYYVEIAVPESVSFTTTFAASNTLSYEGPCNSGGCHNSYLTDNLSGSLYVDPGGSNNFLSSSTLQLDVDCDPYGHCPMYDDNTGALVSGSTIAVNGNGLSGSVSLSSSASPPCTERGCFSFSWQQNPISVPAGQSVADFLTIYHPYSTANGWYFIAVTGTNGGTTSTTSIRIYYRFQGGGGGCGCRPDVPQGA